MGAAGSVSIYDEATVRQEYADLWGDLGYTIEDDWYYPSWDSKGSNKVRVELAGCWYLLDYADDQGRQDGTQNPFWFKSLPWVDDPTGRTVGPKGRETKIRVPDPEAFTKEWGDIDARLPEGSPDRPWEAEPHNRATSTWEGESCPAQVRVLAALRKAGVVGDTEVWT